MLFNKNEWVYYKGKPAKIFSVFEDNKTYIIQLYGYRGFDEIHKQVSEKELYPYVQECLF